MSVPQAILWLVVLVVGIPSSWWNPTAGALVLCWVVSESVYYLTGNSLAFEFYIYPDMFVLAVIVAKASAHLPADVGLHKILYQAWCTDWPVILIFPIMWAIYVIDLHPYYQWWSLYFLALAQFLAAGWEALHPRPCDYREVGDPYDTRLLCEAANDSS